MFWGYFLTEIRELTPIVSTRMSSSHDTDHVGKFKDVDFAVRQRFVYPATTPPPPPPRPPPPGHPAPVARQDRPAEKVNMPMNQRDSGAGGPKDASATAADRGGCVCGEVGGGGGGGASKKHGLSNFQSEREPWPLTKENPWGVLLVLCPDHNQLVRFLPRPTHPAIP